MAVKFEKWDSMTKEIFQFLSLFKDAFFSIKQITQQDDPMSSDNKTGQLDNVNFGMKQVTP
jgi:hypothetical protein